MSDLSTTPYALVVDDDALIRWDTDELFREFGFRTLEATGVAEAILALQAHGHAVVILFTDVQMPGGRDGFSLAREVSDTWPEIAIIVTSGETRPRGGDLPAGATFIGKPFNAKTIRAHLLEVLPDGKKPEPLKHGYTIGAR